MRGALVDESRWVTTWYLELSSPSDFRPSPVPNTTHAVNRLVPSDAELVRELYGSIGAELHWTERAGWSRLRWQAHLAQPAVQLLGLELGHRTVGYVELHSALDGALKLSYLGLLPALRGRGWGGRLLSAAVSLGWSLRSTRRIWLHTCSLDDPAALANYRARGFSIYSQKLELAQLARSVAASSSTEQLPSHTQSRTGGERLGQAELEAKQR